MEQKQPFFDFHTHRLDTPPGQGIVSLPQSIVRRPQLWQPQHGAFYAAGIHPWWTADADFVLDDYLDALSHLLTLPEVVQVGECGLDRLRGADLETQCAVFAAQVALSEQHHRPMTLHVVRAFDVILALRNNFAPDNAGPSTAFAENPPSRANSSMRVSI